MPKVNRYNVYDNDTLIMENVTRRDVIKELGDAPNIANYVDRNVKYKGRYSYVVVAEGDCTEDRFIKEWKEVIDLFKNVIWVKTGGRKLAVGGRVCQMKE